MSYSLTWLPNVLISAGLKVAECPGWQSCGIAEMGKVEGILCHHTATTALTGNMPSLHTLIHGRGGANPLQGPLSQLGLGRDGTYYIIAAGKCNHAGPGKWQGITEGNTHFIGIEAENTGIISQDPWPAIQIDAYHRGAAAILKHIGKGAEFCAGHKEYRLPKGAKTDPDFDMEAFRTAVSNILNNNSKPPLIPPIDPSGRPTLRRGIANDASIVKILQAKILVSPDGFFGPKTEAAVRAFQKLHQLVPDGIVGPKTWTFIIQS